VVWCQEEPQNMGCWSFAAPQLTEVLDAIGREGPKYVGRAASASPATGFLKVFMRDQQALVAEALAA
ncbi:MAG: hypothetical protein O7A65_04410, partial [Proteobacteria bacterium]|nr:hypothetical protein [Pseudomonadota bacterium]